MTELQQRLKEYFSKFKITPTETNMRKHASELVARIYEITKNCKPDLHLRARISLIEQGLTEPPICPACSKEPILWKDYVREWSETCSHKCSNKYSKQKNGPAIRAKTEKTCLERYGTRTPAEAQAVQDRAKQTNRLERGVDYPTQDKSVLLTREENIFKEHGVRHVFQIKEVQEKIAQTNLVRYGSEYPTGNKEVVAKRYEERKIFLATLEEELVEYQTRKIYQGDTFAKTNFPLLVAKAEGIYGDYPLIAKIELMEKNLTSPPKCKFCKIRPVLWSCNYWLEFCSKSCSCRYTYCHSYKEILAKAKATWLRTLKVDNPAKNPEVAAKKKATNLERYGNEYAIASESGRKATKETNQARFVGGHPSRDPRVKAKIKKSLGKYAGGHPARDPEVRERKSKTCIKRWGFSNPMQNIEVQDTHKKSIVKIYGVENIMFVSEIKKRHITNLRKVICLPEEKLAKLTSVSFWEEEHFTQKKSIGQIADEVGVCGSSAYNYLRSCGFTPLKLSKSYGETQVGEFISQFVPVEIRYNYLAGSKKEVDIYVPSKNLAFEYNGLYWHSTEHRDNKYHLEKTLECEKLGVELIHIWEDDWWNKKDLMKRKLKYLLGLENKKVSAGKCQVIIPTFKQRREFYEQNHVKGFGSGSICYALEFKDELVAMMTIQVTNQGHDLNRFATNCSVRGGFSKLLAHFKRNHSWERIYTFADRSWSQGDVYFKAGFKLVEVQPPTFYGVEGKRVNRRHYTHPELRKRFPNLRGSQTEIMEQAKIPRIWDCGQLKFEMINAK